MEAQLPESGFAAFHHVACPTCKSGFFVYSPYIDYLTPEKIRPEYEKHRAECDREHSKVRFKKVYGKEAEGGA